MYELCGSCGSPIFYDIKFFFFLLLWIFYIWYMKLAILLIHFTLNCENESIKMKIKTMVNGWWSFMFWLRTFYTKFLTRNSIIRWMIRLFDSLNPFAILQMLIICYLFFFIFIIIIINILKFDYLFCYHYFIQSMII